MPLMLGFIQNIGPMQWGILLVVGLLIFGKRLPEIGRSLGKSVVEFKRGLKGIEDEIDKASREDSSASDSTPQIAEQAESDTRRISTTDEVEKQPQSG